MQHLFATPSDTTPANPPPREDLKRKNATKKDFSGTCFCFQETLFGFLPDLF